MEEDLSWLQSKVQAQKVALARLNQRVVNQRAVLRTLTSLGYELSEEQWADLKILYPEVRKVADEALV